MIKIISLSKTILLNLLLFIAISLSLVTFLLLSGVRFEQIELSQARIDGLFVQYDDGFVLTADAVEVTPTEGGEPLSGDEVVSITNKLLLALKSVNRIVVDKITYGDHNLSATYRDHKLIAAYRDATVEAYLSTIDDLIVVEAKQITYPPLELTASAKLFADPYANSVRAFADIDSAMLKSSLTLEADQNQVTLQTQKSHYAYEKYTGDFWAGGTFDIASNVLAISGKLDTLDILSDFRVDSDLKTVDIHLYNTKILSLATLMETLNLPKNVSEWIYGKIMAKSYILDSFYLPIDLQTRRPVWEQMQAKAVLEQGSVRFHDDLKRVHAAEIDLDISGTDLFFVSKDAYYDHTYVEVNGSITSLLDHPLLTVNVTSETQLDDTLHEILGAYRIPLESLNQKEGKNASIFTLELGLGYDKLATRVDSRFEDAGFELFGRPIRSKGGRVRIDDGKINLDEINLAYNHLADLNITGSLDLTQKELNAEVTVNMLNVFDGKLVDMHDKVTDLNFSYKEGFSLNADTLNTTLDYDNDTLSVKVSDLTPFVESSPILRTFDIYQGQLYFTKKGDRMEATAVVDSNGTSLVENGEFITHFKATYQNDGNSSSANLNDKVFVDIQPQKIDVTYSNLDISIDRLMERYSKTSKRRELVKGQYEEEKSDAPLMINLYARDSNFLYEDRILPSEQYNLLINGDYLNFSLDHGKTHLKVDKEFDTLTLSAKNIDSNFTKKLFKFEMSEGKANLLTSGSIKTKEFYGVLTIKDATVKGFTLINNIIAFVNTVPSLVTLQNPGFNAEGYKLKKGIIEFYVSDNMLYLTTVRMIGVNTDIIGYGQVNLDDKSLDLTLTLSTIKGLSNLLGKIPLVGYVLLGDDKTIGTLISVKGPLDNPEVETTFAENAALYPFSILKRTVLWPFKLFEDDSEDGE